MTALTLAALWLLLSGYFDHPLLLVFGALSVILCVWLAHRAGMLDSEGVPGGVFPGIIGYMVWLTFEIGKSNIIVARQALAVKPQLSPKMFRIALTGDKSSPQTVVGKVIFANSITLTPGTVSVDLEEDHILIHALTEDLADEPAILDMGARVAKTEGNSGRQGA